MPGRPRRIIDVALASRIDAAMVANGLSMRDLATMAGVFPSTLTRSMALKSFSKELAAKVRPHLAPATQPSLEDRLHELLHILAEAHTIVRRAEALTGELLDLPGAKG